VPSPAMGSGEPRLPASPSLTPEDRLAVVGALRTVLEVRSTPPDRIRLACRSTDLLLSQAITRQHDGSVYVITGDIPAMWLRDALGQVRPLLALAEDAPIVVEIAIGLLRTQIEQVLRDPRANAFNPGPTGQVMRRDFPDQSPWVFERKYAVDSLCAPLTLAWLIWQTTGSTRHAGPRFREAAQTILSLWRRGQAHEQGSYTLVRRFGRRVTWLSHGGKGAPIATTGMTWSGFRPSDDACVYGYNVPANACASVSLDRLGDLLGEDDLAHDARILAAEIRAGIAAHGIATTSDGTPMYAYEVDGLGNKLLLDDANVPSLVSLPYLGFCSADDPLYASTRAFALSSRNPCWVSHGSIQGVGSGHSRRGWVWPLAIAMEGLTAADQAGREDALRRLEKTVKGDLLFHES